MGPDLGGLCSGDFDGGQLLFNAIAADQDRGLLLHVGRLNGKRSSMSLNRRVEVQGCVYVFECVCVHNAIVSVCMWPKRYVERIG